MVDLVDRWGATQAISIRLCRRIQERHRNVFTPTILLKETDSHSLFVDESHHRTALGAAFSDDGGKNVGN